VGKDFADLGIDTNASFLDSKKSTRLPQMSAQDAAALQGMGGGGGGGGGGASGGRGGGRSGSGPAPAASGRAGGGGKS